MVVVTAWTWQRSSPSGVLLRCFLPQNNAHIFWLKVCIYSRRIQFADASLGVTTLHRVPLQLCLWQICIFQHSRTRTHLYRHKHVIRRASLPVKLLCGAVKCTPILACNNDTLGQAGKTPNNNWILPKKCTNTPNIHARWKFKKKIEQASKQMRWFKIKSAVQLIWGCSLAALWTFYLWREQKCWHLRKSYTSDEWFQMLIKVTAILHPR